MEKFSWFKLGVDFVWAFALLVIGIAMVLGVYHPEPYDVAGLVFIALAGLVIKE